MSSPFDKSEFALLYRSRAMDALVRLAEMLKEQWQGDVVSGNTEFQYIKNSLERDGKILGVAAFLKEIERLANQP